MAIDNVMRNILDAAREYGFFVDRGDPGSPDYIKVQFTTDGNWHTLDLSHIVPEHAKAVSVNLFLAANLINKFARFKKHGQINAFNRAGINTQTAAVNTEGDLTIIIDEDRKIEYQIANAFWFTISFTVKGWWF